MDYKNSACGDKLKFDAPLGVIVAPNPQTPFPLREGGIHEGSPPLCPAWGYAPNPVKYRDCEPFIVLNCLKIL